MPIALSPDNKFKIVLEADKDDPKAAHLVCHYLTTRDFIKMEALGVQLSELGTVEEKVDLCFQIVSLGLLEVVNTDIADLAELYTFDEFIEVVNEFMTTVSGPSHKAKKKSASPSASSTKKSVKIARRRTA